MGAKGGLFAVAVSLICSIILIVCCCTDQWAHKRFALGLGINGVMDMDISLTTVRTHSAHCDKVARGKANKKLLDFCDHMGYDTLQNKKDSACGSVALAFFGWGDEKCNTYSALYWTGIAIIFCVSFQVLMSLIGSYFAVHFYQSAQTKGRYKRSYYGLAVLMFFLGPMITLPCLVIWGFYTTWIDDIYRDSWKGIFAPRSSDDFAMSLSWVFALMAIIFQLVSTCVLCATAPDRGKVPKGGVKNANLKNEEEEEEDESAPIYPPFMPPQFQMPNPWAPAPPAPTHMGQAPAAFGYPPQGFGQQSGYGHPQPGFGYPPQGGPPAGFYGSMGPNRR